MKKNQEKKLSGAHGKQKRKRTKVHGDKYGTKLHVQQIQPSPPATCSSIATSEARLSRVAIASASITGASTTTSTSDSCSGEGRKASTSSSSTGSCTNLTSQLETTSFLITDSTTTNSSKTFVAHDAPDKLQPAPGDTNQRPSATSYCSATDDDVSTIM